MLLAALRLVYLVWLCPYTLVEDEAHYWEWSRRLAWSYYSKGPGIALALRAATGLFGVSEWAVRMPAVLASLAATLGVAGMAADVAGWGARGRRTALYAAGAFQLAPAFQATALLSTIDGPYVACWTLACWAAWRAFERRSLAAWVGLGAAFAAGFLFKYTILLLIPGLLLYIWIRRGRLTLSARWRVGVLMAILLGAGGLAPVAVWNAQNGWPTVHHLLGHLGVAGGDMPVTQHIGGATGRAAGGPSGEPGGGPGEGVGEGTGWRWDRRWTLEFWPEQLGMIGPGLLLAAVGVCRLRGSGAWKGGEPGGGDAGGLPPRAHAGGAFLLCCALPLLGFYFLLTLAAEVEGNWPLAAYATLLPLAGWTAAEGMAEYRAKVAAWRALPRPRPRLGLLRKKPELLRQALWHLAVGYGVVAGLGMLRADLLARAPTLAGLAPLPVPRVAGAREMATHAAELGETLRRETGREPMFIAQHYGRASLLAFYLPGRPAVYSTSSTMGGRRTQYDYWPDTDLYDPALLGRPAVVVGATREQWAELFETVRPVSGGTGTGVGGEEGGRLRGDGKRGRWAFVCTGFKGYGGRGRGGGGGSARGTVARPGGRGPGSGERR